MKKPRASGVFSFRDESVAAMELFGPDRAQALGMRGAHAIGEPPADPTAARGVILADTSAWVEYTPRGMTDCMIAAVATRSRATILAHDTDLIHVANVFGLPIDPASLSI